MAIWQKNVFSVDVEDWFHILDITSTPDISAWHQLESRIEKNFLGMLDLFDAYGVKVTCFFLGWVAKTYPALVRKAHKRGHEVASHGFAHQLIFTKTPKEFYNDIVMAKKLLEDITGEELLGYRAPGFSITRQSSWALDEIARAGYSYDSSIFPATRGHGGINWANLAPHRINTNYGDLVEFPISVATILNARIYFFGGGYLRFFPYFLIRFFANRINREGRPVIYYVHPRELDPTHPRLPMGLKRSFKSYVNLSSTRSKIVNIFRADHLTTFSQLLKYEYPA